MPLRGVPCLLLGLKAGNLEGAYIQHFIRSIQKARQSYLPVWLAYENASPEPESVWLAIRGHHGLE